MNVFLDALSKKLAEQWLSVLVLPGALWVATAFLAARAGHRRAFDLRMMSDELDRWTENAPSTGVIVFVLLGLLLASAAAGLAATGLGAVAQRLWMARGHRPPGRWLVTWRQKRWRAAEERVVALMSEALRTHPPRGARTPEGDASAERVVSYGPALAEELARRDAIGLEFPGRPTWIGDRWRANSTRIHRAYGLDIAVVWPRLWSVLPETLRADIAAAQASCTAAATCVGWGALYAALGVLWWPGLLLGGTVLIAGVLRSRTSTTTLCLLVESAADLHGPTLAEQLRMSCPGPVTSALGEDMSALFRKDRGPLAG
ncbi:hypothetical protein FH609_028050 [Streptomyces sp. 3MP-14]|uniref:Vegetative cell wall protein gp1 n=1 Tax=Streptomyces mimosae TaxID=2586635 RepID=A0A5N5ZUV8_9ACTN|nr:MULTISPECIES: hypothetical protein [Streptomyces]KAB8160284.1 hypothetical protein FH607_027115 [Streptomyces mimosae]KAB8172954.1 hypothetical protein FH609_028050 [Streptomyces sp. 3MP-14]